MRTTALLPAWALAAALSAAGFSRAAGNPTAEQALRLVPVQKGIDFDTPAAAELPNCTIEPKKLEGRVGWIIAGPSGVLLRRFVDTNGDNVVDQWSYCQDGLEVYRDIDANFNGKADQHRWFHTGGSRWGIDANEDGTIDSWKQISAEEVSAEAVAALATRDAARFKRLLPAPEELQGLGLGKARAAALAERVAKLAAEFETVSAAQKTVTPETRWLQFSAGKPGAVPAGTEESTRDLNVYENAVAVVETAGKNAELALGTLVQTAGGWRLIDVPHELGEGQVANTGFFYHGATAGRPGAEGAPGVASEAVLAALEEIDKRAAAATAPEQLAQFTVQRIEVLERAAADAKTAEDRMLWLRQLTDVIGAAVQVGTCSDGAQRLQALYEKLRGNAADKDLAAYVRFRCITAEYGLQMQAARSDYKKLQEIQETWLKNLDAFVTEFPAASDAAEALLQLAIGREFAGEDAEALKAYTRVVQEYADSAAAKTAAGAQARLESVGKVLALAGKSPTGSAVDVAQFRGKFVLVQYWATYSQPAVTDMAGIKDLVAKYGKHFAVVGVNLDNDPKELAAFLAKTPLPWPQIYEDGGLNSRPAVQLGILTLPTMLLIDREGKVLNRNIQVAEVEEALKEGLK